MTPAKPPSMRRLPFRFSETGPSVGHQVELVRAVGTRRCRDGGEKDEPSHLISQPSRHPRDPFIFAWILLAIVMTRVLASLGNSVRHADSNSPLQSCPRVMSLPERARDTARSSLGRCSRPHFVAVSPRHYSGQRTAVASPLIHWLSLPS
jgi:hypothetical protein